MEEKRVGIIGGGISGLLACKYTLEKGLTPIVFEASSGIGGVWTQTIESTRLQSPKRTFEFTDFPWPKSVRGRYPHNTEVLMYVEEYAKKFGLMEYIQLNTKVIGIDYVGVCDDEMDSWDFWSGNGEPFGSKGKWHILVQHEDFTTQEYEVEFLILCVGRYSGLANMPEFDEGPVVFAGNVMHSMEYSAMDNQSARELIKGKRIVVVGSQKSAIDIAAECANANGPEIPCTLVQRTIAWALPSGCFWWGINLGFLYGSRFSELLVHKPGENIIYSVLASLLSPLRWGFSKFVESYLKWNLPLKKYSMVPKQSFLQDMSSCKSFLLPNNFYSKVEEGSIVLKRSTTTKCFSFCKQGLIVDGEIDKPIQADLVIFATGYKGQEKLKNMFSSKGFQNYIMGSSNSVVPLYRHIIHPRIPNLAIIGYSGSITNLHTSEMRCQWLAHFLDQTFKLPTIKEMEKEIEKWEIYMKTYAGKEYKRACIAAIHIWYNDQLCNDIGCNYRRKKSFYDEWFRPYLQSDYVRLSPKISPMK